ncbi:MAG: DUF2079 domain-containing protein [Anaerolineae bacterium]|nr:DUF2079 domain-containing protein [Anaerolineae bacterium]
MTFVPKLSKAVPIWLCVLMLVYVATYATLSIVKHDNFHSFTLDLGIMTQVTWNTAHGRLFETSLDRAMDTELIGSYMGNHVRPLLLFLAPLYRLWPDPRVLLSMQSIVLAVGAVPLYWIARRNLKRPILHYVLVIVYLLYPALGFINLFDFHPVAFCVPALLFAYWALLEERKILFWAMILLTLSTKEELVVPVAAFGVYCLFFSAWRRRGVWLLGTAIAWAFLCFIVIIPAANEGRAYRFFDLWSRLPFLGELGSSGGGSGGALFSVDSAYFVAHLLIPLGFLPLFGPELFAVSWPSFAYLLLSDRAALHQVGFQYPAVLIPWLFLATIQGLSRLERRLRLRHDLKKWLPVSLLLIGTLGANLPFNPVRTSWLSGYFMHMPQHEQIEAAMALIPPRAGVATVNPFGPHLANRRCLIGLEKYTTGLNMDHMAEVDYVLLDLVDCRLFHTQDPRGDYGRMTYEILDTRDFGVRYWSDRILLLERGLPPGEEVDEVRAYVDDLVEEGRPCWP